MGTPLVFDRNNIRLCSLGTRNYIPRVNRVILAIFHTPLARSTQFFVTSDPSLLCHCEESREALAEWETWQSCVTMLAYDVRKIASSLTTSRHR